MIEYSCRTETLWGRLDDEVMRIPPVRAFLTRLEWSSEFYAIMKCPASGLSTFGRNVSHARPAGSAKPHPDDPTNVRFTYVLLLTKVPRRTTNSSAKLLLLSYLSSFPG
ncbi:hypothetical protein AC1031_020402 [Aphanomyces cochlioides]|nr:hypothetical protein AC1031_020402 [Aphanomyces cochlioides]